MSESNRAALSFQFTNRAVRMVNDPKNSDLIRWSDTGDSFFGELRQESSPKC